MTSSKRALPNLSAPQFMRDAAEKGLRWHEEGLSGDGVTEGTLREARAMRSGDISANKWVRISAWIARHLVDLEAPDANPNADGYPSPGVVAHALWGSTGGKDGAMRVKDYADRIVAAIEEESRNDNGPPAVITDIDDTLFIDGGVNRSVVDYLDSFEDTSVFVITGRFVGDRDQTVADLDAADVDYTELFMRPDGMTSAEFKRDVAARLLETYNVMVAIENDADAREAYQSLGITAIAPGDVPVVVDDESDTQDDEETSAYRAGRISSMAKVETREFTTKIELRAEGDGNTFSGYAALFNSESEPLPFREVIAPGAFKRSLKSRNDIKMLWNHDSGSVLASTKSGTLQLTEDERGLKVTATLPDTTTGRDARELISKGIVDAMSFGFSVPSGGDSWSADGSTRTLKSIRLHEVSVVAWPAYAATGGTVAVRALDKVAQRAEVDAEELQDVLVQIQNGAESISPADRALLEKVLDRLAPANEADEVVGDLALLELKKKKLSLLEL
jgi:HK97 family phage prohead protease